MKVGDYVRTKDGLIAKYIETYKECELHLFDSKIQWHYEYYIEEIDFGDWEEFIKEKVVKSSPNIIDLIEVGDYVNGHKVIYTIGKIHKRIFVEYVNMDELLEIKLEQIKSIVTKEQFESMEYKINED